MQIKNPAAVALGSIKSEKKAQASRENGKKGGKPKQNLTKEMILERRKIALEAGDLNEADRLDRKLRILAK